MNIYECMNIIGPNPTFGYSAAHGLEHTKFSMVKSRSVHAE